MTNEVPKFINDGSVRPTTNRNYKLIMVVSCSTHVVIHRITHNSIHGIGCITK